MQMPLRTQSSVEVYISNQEWRDARLDVCPFHASGGCAFARHGTYARVTPPGLRVARWYCPEGRRTFSLLPDFLAAGFPGLLASIEDAVTVAISATSMEAAADALRGPAVTLPSALRWLRRRIRGVQAALDVVPAVPAVEREPPVTARTRCAALHTDPDQGQVLVGLRRSLPQHMLNGVPAPVGFRASGGPRYARESDQHDMGPDGAIGACYGTATPVRNASCDAGQSIHSPLRPPRPPP
jgi:hypothetical protein